LVRSSIYAEFAVDSENSICSLASLDRCYNNPPVEELTQRRCGLDFAAGNAENCIAVCHGNKVSIIKAWKEKDTMTAAQQFVVELNKLKMSIGLQPAEVYGDASGLGLPIIHRLKELGWNINLFYGQEKAKDESYRNMITECWLEGIKKIQNCQIILPNDTELKGQILARKQRLNSSGKMELESKQDMAARGVASPDRADAVFMAITNTTSGLTTYAKAIPTNASHGYIGMFA
jgi:hypothetical protein